MPKYLAINSDFVGSPCGLYTHIQQHYFFCKNSNAESSIVVPYTIITDGCDVVMFNNNKLGTKLSVGFESPVVKPKLMFGRSLLKFNRMMENAIWRSFFDKFDFDFSTTTPKEIDIVSTIKSFYSLDNKIAYLLYFMMLPENKVVKFKPKNDVSVVVYPYSDLVSVAMLDTNSDILTKTIGYMISIGELDIPAIL